MAELIKVGMADLKVCSSPDILTTLGLGSCVGICLYDPVTKVAGLAHIMLPDSTLIKNNQNRAKFADTGMTDLIMFMEQRGAKRNRMVAKIAGGAKMFSVSGGSSDIMNVGQRNVESVKGKLRECGIRLLAEDTGLNFGRTIEFSAETGQLLIKSVGKALKIV